jgi:muramoyltetrapeptide carboxypeptidase
MNRRWFVHRFLLGAFAMPLFAASIPRGQKLIRPGRLQKGSRIALIAPASPATPERLQMAQSHLTALDLKVVEGKALRRRTGFLAGSDQERLDDLHRAFADPDIDGIWCVRGGYGCTRLLGGMDMGLIRSNPKPFIGYSDITALHVAIGRKAGLMTFHGPVAIEAPTDFALRSLRRVLFDGLQPEWTAPEAIRPGAMRGRLTGGNLSLLAALSGTPWAPDFKGCIAILEDIGERPYRLDRMLTQLLDGTNLRQASGILVGDFSDCEPPEGESDTQSSRDVLEERLGRLGIPVYAGLPVGHIPAQLTWGYGMDYQFNPG